MAHPDIQHRRTHNLLLISRLLSQRDFSSSSSVSSSSSSSISSPTANTTTTPFTLVFDSLEQTAKFLLGEYVRRARVSKSNVIFLAFETSRSRFRSSGFGGVRVGDGSSDDDKNSSNSNNKDGGVDVFLPCYELTPAQITESVNEAVRQLATRDKGKKRHNLLLIDSMYTLCTLSQQQRQQTTSTPSLSSLPTTTTTNTTTTSSASSDKQQQQQQQQHHHHHHHHHHTPFDLTHFLMSLITPGPDSAAPPPPTTTSLVAVYHTDVPLPPPSLPLSTYAYRPHPLTLLTYLATTLITTHSMTALLAARAATSRSLAPPQHGLDEIKEGIVVGLPSLSSPSTSTSTSTSTTSHTDPHSRSNSHPHSSVPTTSFTRGLVLEVEHRRKSGRGVHEHYFLPFSFPASTYSFASTPAPTTKEPIILLDDHPLFSSPDQSSRRHGTRTNEDEEMKTKLNRDLTFELGLDLTDRQRLERDGIVLPYFDAQARGTGGTGGGSTGVGGAEFGRGSEGGRILYDMGDEDDFDEEEDEI